MEEEKNAEEKKKDQMPGIPDLPDMVEEFVDEFGRRLTELRELHEQLEKNTTTASAERRMLSVTVGPQGELVALKFNDDGYRSLSSKELAEIIVTTVGKARTRALSKINDAIVPTLPAGLNWDALLKGGTNVIDAIPDDPFETLDLAAFLARHRPDDH
ncbi:YbaB/EbfC family nucleoid-associated protein [Actinomadura sp. 6N118]|uniref:YbaB/EbfC family nucleoid-associated protein n=1 Tax=Actinomadura sp. 6N118 TaxID=3375151 RepID=UPI0037904531